MGKVFEALKKAGEKTPAAQEAELDTTSATPNAEPEGDSVSPPQAARTTGKDRKKRASVLQYGDWDERLTLAATVTGPVAESFRTLRTRILHPLAGTSPRTLLVTSAAPGEGKSFVCANLGISLAQGVDQHGLLVDADLRKPSLARLFGYPNDRGLVNYLRDKQDLGSLMTGVGVDKLRIIPAGLSPVNPAELLGSESMADLVAELRSRYEDRMVIFDSPPLRAAAETAILAKHVDAVVLVVRWGASRREHVQALVEQVGKEKIVGVVFNAYQSTVFDSRVFGAYEYQKDYYYGDK